MDAVHRFEGTVNQVLGDGIMALFGAPWPMRTTPCAPVTPL
jgi:class 3 adenylate cyclase